MRRSTDDEQEGQPRTLPPCPRGCWPPPAGQDERGGETHEPPSVTAGVCSPEAATAASQPLNAVATPAEVTGELAQPALVLAPPAAEPKPNPEAAALPVVSRTSHRALSADERRQILGVLHEERFVDKAPTEIFATLLDEKVYYCSIRTMYRILADEDEVRERRNVRRHPQYRKPELLATGPNQVWSWDITKLRVPVKWALFSLYVILDSSAATSWHSGIGLLTPRVVHYGLAPRVIELRRLVLQGAYQAHPERFVRRGPRPPQLPEAVWINPPARSEPDRPQQPEALSCPKNL